MALTYNRLAFRSPLVARPGSCPPLLGAYVSLVAIELFLKDHLSQHIEKVPATHDIPKLLKTLSTYVDNRYSGAFASMAAQLSTRLANIWCQDKHGNPAPVPCSNYPYIRYVRHCDDWKVSASNDEDLNGILAMSRQIIHAILKATGERV